MKAVLPLAALVLLASSCTTAYKSGQTPDDVYFSPERKIEHNEYVDVNRDNDRNRYRSSRRQAEVDDDYAYNDERYLRMKVRNRRMWSNLDYYNDPYALGYYGRPGIYTGIGLYGGNFWSPYSYWNSFNNWNYYYNPYYLPHGNVIVVNPNSSPIYNKPRTFNLNTFVRGENNNSSNKYPVRGYNNGYNSGYESRPSRGASSMGNDLRRSFGTNNNTNNSYSTPSRSSSGSSGGSSSSGSSRSSSAPVRRF